MNRNRKIYAILVSVIIILGLLSRSYREYLPKILGDYSGDILWGLMVYLIFGFVFKKLSVKYTFTVSLFFSYTIEFSQLYSAPLIDSIRGTMIGGLILGHGFLYSDLICYLLGVLIGVTLETSVLKRGTISYLKT